MKFLLNLFFILLVFLTSNSQARDYNIVFSDNNFNITSLMNAVYQNDEKATNVFLKSGANVNESNIAGVAPLHIAAKNNSINAMKVLIKYNVILDIKDNELWTPLMRACLNKNHESVEILIKNGADIWLKNSFNESALLHSVISDCKECIKIIIENTTSSNYEINDVINEINKSLKITYKKEDEEIENMLNEFYDSIVSKTADTNINKKDIERKEKKEKNKDKKTQTIAKKENIVKDVKIKKEIEYITKKIYIFQGEVRVDKK